NEIMFDPASAQERDAYVELFNRSDEAVNISGWRLRDAIDFDFPNNTILGPGEVLVVAKDAVHLRSLYPGLNTVNCVGDYNGRLSNRGERIELNKPDELMATNRIGQLETNHIHITIDEVTYGQGGRWSDWTAGGGSSLELRHPNADPNLAPNWGASDESSKSEWVTVEATGVMDNGYADAYQLHVTLLGAGEVLLDNVEVIPAGGNNLLSNPSFETGTDDWIFQGNHNGSIWEPNEGDNSSGSLRIRTTGRGDTGSNRIRIQLPTTLSSGTVVTLRARARWLKGNPNLLLRLRGNWHEALGYTLTTYQLGTPGQPNSLLRDNIGPAITDTRHFPPLPPANAPVLVLAKVDDPDGLSSLAVRYRIDPTYDFITVAMTNNGAGLYSTIIPGQPSGT
ncbi:MAG TPA: lamin tail domain-containing protein, partial [Anaerolineae bacterium]|nr:lamin tail domain-containing protein [Anaerolineae bacterium]